MKTLTSWKHDQVFESSQENNLVMIDGNKTEGMSPKALLLSGLAGCSGIDVVEALKKMRVGFSDFTISAEAEQTDEHPRVFKDIYITYSIRTDIANKDKVEKAINLSLEKYCGVSAMLKKNSAIYPKLQLLQ
jgi:putative redox protein